MPVSTKFMPYRNKALHQAIIALGINASQFARKLGWNAETRDAAFYDCKQPSFRSAKRELEVRIRFQEITGLLWEQAFPNDGLTSLKHEIAKGTVLLAQIQDSLQLAGAAPKTPKTPFEYLVEQEEASHSSFSVSLQQVMKKVLTERQRFVLHLRFIENQSLEECGRVLRVTRDRIRQILAKALAKLRKPTILTLLPRLA